MAGPMAEEFGRREVGTDVPRNQGRHCVRIANRPHVVEPHEPLDGRDGGGYGSC